MAATRAFANLISGDSHVMEPYDLWWKVVGGNAAKVFKIG